MVKNTEIDLLSADDFAIGQHPFKKFSIVADILNVDGDERENVNLSASYDLHMRLEFEYREEFDVKKMFHSPKNVFISGIIFPESCPLLTVQTVHSSDTGTKITFVPMQEPMLLQFGLPTKKVEAVILNGPEMLWSGMKLQFCYEDFHLNLMDFKNTNELRKQSRSLKKGNVATGTITLCHKNKNEINHQAALEAIEQLDRFLMFVKGTHCGVGNIVGHTSENEVAFAYLGFTRIDQFDSATGWCDQSVIKFLPEVFGLYCSALKNKQYANILLTAIEFYRASNILRESSLEMALVASHASLETLVPHILSTRAGWSNNLLGKQIGFHDKLRATAKFVGLTVDPLEHLKALKKRSKADSNIDAYELLSIFRNRIVHQGKPYKYTGKELHEVWCLTQWLCEIFVFYLIGYRGKMNDRRYYQGWRGEGIGLVPLPAIPNDTGYTLTDDRPSS